MSSAVIRIGHVADVHLTEGERGDDTWKALEFIAADGAAQGVQLWLVVGDLTGTTVPHRATDWESDRMDRWFQSLARVAPVVIVWGNHDKLDDIVGWGRLDPRAMVSAATPHARTDGAAWPIYSAVGPSVLEIQVACSFDETMQAYGATCNVVTLPYAHPQILARLGLTVGDSIRSDMEAGAEKYRAWLSKMAPKLTEGRPTLLAAHMNIVGSSTAGDEIMAGHEVELNSNDLDEFPADYVALGHIHKYQRVAARAYYPGPPAPTNFGEERIEAGYIIADVAAGAEPVIYRRLTPVRELLTVKPTWTAKGWDFSALPDDLSGIDVRAVVRLPEEAKGIADVALVQAELERRGAARQKVERSIIPAKRESRCEALRAAVGVPAKLEAYWDTMNPSPTREQRDRALRALATLEAE